MAMTTPRPAALPSSTALRMVLVAVALVVAGLFVGVALQNAFDRTWSTEILACLSAHPRDVQAEILCEGPVERARAAAAAGVALVIVALAAAVVVIAPALIRRWKRLVPADQRFAPAVHAIARMAVAESVRPPGVLISPASKGEPFCLGRPGDYRIALPRKLALTSGSDLFRALVGHELAHLVHRDVALSWMARSLWFVLGPALAVPVVVSVLHGDLLLALDVLWRSAVLMAVVLLVVRALLRAREYDADLRAARVGNAGVVLDGALAHRREPRRGWLAWHPSAESRRAVLHNPASAATWSWVDGLVLGFLVALALPIVTLLASAALRGLNVAGGAALVGAVVVGPLFGATVGLGLWRERFLAVDGGRGSIPRVTVGVLAGAVLGELVSLAGVATGRPDLPVAVPLALAGTTAMIGGLGALWAANRGSSSRVALPAAGLGALAAAVLLWAGQEAELQVREMGWGLLVTWLTTPGTTALIALAATTAVLAAAAWWAVRAPGQHRPAGLSLRAGVAVGLAAGLCGGLGLVGYRLLAGAPADDADTIARFSAAVLGAGLVCALVMVVLGVARGAPGIGMGLLAGPMATVTTGVLYLVLNVVLGGNPAVVAGLVFGTAVPAGLLMTAPGALLGLVPVPPVRSIAAVVATAAVAGVVATVGLGVAHANIRPQEPVLTDVPTGAEQSDTIPRELYVPLVGRALLDRRVQETDAFAKLKADNPPSTEAAARLQADILPVATDLLDTARSYAIDDPAVLAVHQHALAGARDHLDAYQLFIAAFENNDRTLFDRAQRLLLAGDAEWKAWAAAAQTL
jgi:Zn-dependent protease with chaperone function